MAHNDFAVFAAECLEQVLGEVTLRAMFGGHGVYHGGVMMGLVADDCLYLKTDKVTLQSFEDAGCSPFVYETKDGRRTVMSYYTVPEGALEEPDALAPWAVLADEAALRGAVAKASKGARRAKQ